MTRTNAQGLSSRPKLSRQICKSKCDWTSAAGETRWLAAVGQSKQAKLRAHACVPKLRHGYVVNSMQQVAGWNQAVADVTPGEKKQYDHKDCRVA
jgi:hypothetical protein